MQSSWRIKRSLQIGIMAIAILFFIHGESSTQKDARTMIRIPEIPGYVTLKCDFHMHTVFSDGSVWPQIRAEEAWREGLDAIAITDHIEYQPHKEDVKTDHNRSYEIALPMAEALNIILAKGIEITRSMPPGHLNAIFLTDANKVDRKEYRDAIEAAASQGAFLFWNHPGWIGQQPDGKARWYKEHTELHEKNWLHGIEVVNDGSYYPEAHQWCLEKNLTMIGTSDVHGPIQTDYDFDNGEHRPMTLVFATDRTMAALKSALFGRQTAIYWKDKLIGDEQYLRPIFNASIEILNPDNINVGKETTNVQIHNHSDVPFYLGSQADIEDISFLTEITLNANKTVLFPIKRKGTNLSGSKEYTLPFVVKNLWIAPDKGLPIELRIKINFN